SSPSPIPSERPASLAQTGVQGNRVRSNPSNLVVNESKTRHLSKRRRRTVTGVVLRSQGGISLGRTAKRRLRSLIHRWEEFDEDGRRSLAGHLAHARSIEPGFINRLILKFGFEKVRRAQLGRVVG